MFKGKTFKGKRSNTQQTKNAHTSSWSFLYELCVCFSERRNRQRKKTKEQDLIKELQRVKNQRDDREANTLYIRTVVRKMTVVWKHHTLVIKWATLSHTHSRTISWLLPWTKYGEKTSISTVCSLKKKRVKEREIVLLNRPPQPLSILCIKVSRKWTIDWWEKKSTSQQLLFLLIDSASDGSQGSWWLKNVCVCVCLTAV